MNRLTDEQRQAVEQHHGVLQIDGGKYIIMSMNLYRKMMGGGTDDELAASLQAINEGMADIQAGRTIPLDEAKRRLDEKYGV